MYACLTQRHNNIIRVDNLTPRTSTNMQYIIQRNNITNMQPERHTNSSWIIVGGRVVNAGDCLRIQLGTCIIYEHGLDPRKIKHICPILYTIKVGSVRRDVIDNGNPTWAMGCRVFCVVNDLKPTPISHRASRLPEAVSETNNSFCHFCNQISSSPFSFNCYRHKFKKR